MNTEYTLSLKKRSEVAEGTMAFWFDRGGTDFFFKAGQYADFTLIDPPETDSEGNTRTFSIASPPSEKDSIMITTRMRLTAFKNNLRKMPLGTNVKVSAPMGSFTLHQNSAKPALFLVGGIGITPVHSIVLDALQQNLPHELYLFYSNAKPQTTTFLNDFEELARRHPNFHFLPTVTEAPPLDWRYETGKIDEAMIKKHLKEPASAIAYIVGPPAMVSAMIGIAGQSGVDPDNIRTEEFAGY